MANYWLNSYYGEQSAPVDDTWVVQVSIVLLLSVVTQFENKTKEMN